MGLEHDAQHIPRMGVGTARCRAAADRLAVLLATGLYLSYIPSKLIGGQGPAWAQRRRWTGAGFIGALEGLALMPLLPAAPGRLAAFLIAAAALACWLCGRAEKVFGVHDDTRIVLDEVVGFWTTVAFLPRSASWPWWLVGFVLFRFFDAVKLPPYRWLDRLPGGLGVVADDVGAGIAANIVLRVLMGWTG